MTDQIIKTPKLQKQFDTISKISEGNFTSYLSTVRPLQMNSNRVVKFSGLGEVTKMFEYLKKGTKNPFTHQLAI